MFDMTLQFRHTDPGTMSAVSCHGFWGAIFRVFLHIFMPHFCPASAPPIRLVSRPRWRARSPAASLTSPLRCTPVLCTCPHKCSALGPSCLTGQQAVMLRARTIVTTQCRTSCRARRKGSSGGCRRRWRGREGELTSRPCPPVVRDAMYRCGASSSTSR
jgi:hypothetical protein